MRSGRWSALLALVVAGACTAKDSLSFELGPTIKHAVLIALDAEDGSFLGASGLLSPPFAALMETRPSANLIALGYDEAGLPGPFRAPLSAPAVRAMSCAPRLPAPTVMVSIQGTTSPLPAISGPWLEGSCPAGTESLLLHDSAALQRCTATLLPVGSCAFELELATETCGGRMVITGSIQPDGRVCAEPKPPNADCASASDGTGAILCATDRRRVELSLRQHSPHHVESIPIGSGRPRQVPNRLRPLQLEPQQGFALGLLASLNEGYLSDLLVVGQEILLLDHDGRFMDHDCVSENGRSIGPSRLLTYDAELSSLVRTATVPPCAVRLLASPEAIYTAHSGAAASITKSDRRGQILGTVPICPGIRNALIVGIDISPEGQIGVLLDSQPYGLSVWFALFSPDLAPIGGCRNIRGWWNFDPADAPAIGTDLRSLRDGRWVLADENVVGGWIFDGALTAMEGPESHSESVALRYSVQRGLAVPADIGLLTVLPANRLAIARHGRAGAIDLQGIGAAAEISVLPNINSDARPLRAVAWGDTLATPLWQLSGSTLTAALGSIRGTPPRVEPYETPLGPGIPGATAVDPGGRLLILRPWSSEIVRVSR